MEEYYQNLISNKYHLFKEKFEEAKSKESGYINFQLNGFKIRLRFCLLYYEIFIENNNKNFRLKIPIYFRQINFKKLNDDHWHFVFGSEDIGKYIEKYNLDHPTYYDKEKKINITVSSNDYPKIFEDINIIQISDDQFIEYISKNDFIALNSFNNELLITNLYLNIPYDNISTSINNDLILISDKRKQLLKEICSFCDSKKLKFFWLSGGKKIGKTITIKYAINCSNIFYFNFKMIKKMENTSDKKKLIS